MDVSHPPQIPAELRPLLDQKDETIRQLLASLDEAQRRNQQLEYLVELLRRRMYGPRSERIDPAQLLLLAAEVLKAPPAGAPAETEDVADPGSGAPRKPGHGRRPLPANLPRHRIEHPVRPEDVPCPCCGAERTRMGEE